MPIYPDYPTVDATTIHPSQSTKIANSLAISPPLDNSSKSLSPENPPVENNVVMAVYASEALCVGQEVTIAYYALEDGNHRIRSDFICQCDVCDDSPRLSVPVELRSFGETASMCRDR